MTAEDIQQLKAEMEKEYFLLGRKTFFAALLIYGLAVFGVTYKMAIEATGAKLVEKARETAEAAAVAAVAAKEKIDKIIQDTDKQVVLRGSEVRFEDKSSLEHISTRRAIPRASWIIK